MTHTIFTQRSQIRQLIRQKRSKLEKSYQEQAAARIVSRLLKHPILQRSQIVAGYLPADGEVDMYAWFTQAWRQLKQCYLPVVVEQQLLFARYNKSTQLKPNRWGILEPTASTLIPASALDAVIIPLLAFDAKGNRLGRGAGYYDRSFAFLQHEPRVKSLHLIGIGYAFQQMPIMTPADWDVPIHTVITERRTFSWY
jgi:5-formyltetrahydrofolate cyclo-ligase